MVKVTDMGSMFEFALAFNQPLDGWNVDEVTNMINMFLFASSFDQNLGWCVEDDVELTDAFEGTVCEATKCGVTQGNCPP